jgi:outer membrane PBP1 activator LpoA protein
MKRRLATLILAAALTAGTSALAQDKAAGVTDMQALRAAVKADKRAYVAATLALTDAEAKKFWPAYDAYQRTLDMTNRQRNRAVEDVVALNKPLSDAYARILASELVAADEAEIKARRTLLNRVLKALPATKAARYMQIEDKIRDAAAYDIAVTIPLIK